MSVKGEYEYRIWEAQNLGRPVYSFNHFSHSTWDTVTREEFSYIVAHVCVGGLNSGAHESGSSLNILPESVGDLDLVFRSDEDAKT